MFFPNDGSAAAFSWQLHAQSPLQGRLAVKPFFSGCGPRSYRDVGFHFDSEENGGRLTWLPNVRGPKVIVDTNGEYHNEPTPFMESSRDQETASASSENLVTPGTFEFELSSCPFGADLFDGGWCQNLTRPTCRRLSGRSHAKRRSFKNGFGWQSQV